MWLVGKVVRRYIDFLILLIPTSLVSVLFLQQHPYFLFILDSLASSTRQRACVGTVKFIIKATLKKQRQTCCFSLSCSNSAPIQNSNLLLAGALVFRTYIIAHVVHASSCIFNCRDGYSFQH